MLEVEALRISEKLNLYGRARAEALHHGATDDWYVVALIDDAFKMDLEDLRELAEKKAPSVAMIHIAQEQGISKENLIITGIPKRS